MRGVKVLNVSEIALAWLFKHPRALYQQGEVVCAGDFGLLWWPAAALLLGLSIFFARRLRGWSLWRRVTIHGLQLAAVVLVLGLLAQPALEVLRLAAGRIRWRCWSMRRRAARLVDERRGGGGSVRI